MPSDSATSTLIAHVDGASRGNPGPAAYAVVVEDPRGSPVTSLSKFLGRATNNVAEYQALLAALQYAVDSGHSRLRVLTDSELMARQIQGAYKVKSEDLKPLHEEARRLIARLESFSIAHVPREQNRQADRLANQALDRAEGTIANHRDPKTLREANSEDQNTPTLSTNEQGQTPPAVLGLDPSKGPIPDEVNQIAKAVVDAASAVYSGLGPGLLESVYEICLVHELKKRGLAVERQVVVPLRYDTLQLDASLRLNLLVEGRVVVELKSVETLLPVHTAQILTYLRLTGHRLGIIINFNVALIRDGIKRITL